MFKIAVYLIRTNVGCHGDDWRRWTVLSDIHCGRDTIEFRHDNVHEDEIKVVPAHGTDSAICIGSVFLFKKKNQFSVRPHGVKLYLPRARPRSPST